MAASTVTIAGAGPAGLAAAIAIARAGHRVRVLERAGSVGSRFHDDFQGVENWSREEDALDELRRGGIEPTFWTGPFRGGTLYDPAGASVPVESPRPLFYLVRRGAESPSSLDRGLLAQALEAGVEVELGTKARPGSADIDATGPRGRPVAVARGVTFDTDLPDTIRAYLDERLAPGGYVYFLVASGRATLATVLFRDFDRADACLDRSLDAVEETLDGARLPRAPRWGGFGCFGIPGAGAPPRPVTVGEAAGFQDLLFGFGIRSAIVSGILAARSVVEGRDYGELWRERLLPHLEAGVVNRAAFAGLGDLAKVALSVAVSRSSRPDAVLRMLYRSTPLHRALLPLAARLVERAASRERHAPSAE